MMKQIYSLLIALFVIANAFAQKEIIFVCATDLATGGLGDEREQPMVDAILGTGLYNITYQEATYFEPENIDAINAADLVIVGRGVKSGDCLGDDNVRRDNVFGVLTVPTIHTSPWVVRGDRFAFVTGTSEHQDADEAKVVSALIPDESHSVFDGVTITGGAMDWTVGYTSDITPEEGEAGGTVLAKTDDNRILAIVHEAGDALHDGRVPAGLRAYMGNGQDKVEPATYWNFTEGAQQVFLNLVAYMANNGEVNVKSHKTLESLSAYSANGVVNITMENLNRVEIYSISGKMILSENVSGNNVTLKTDLQNGMYIARGFSTDGSVATGKFSVK